MPEYFFNKVENKVKILIKLNFIKQETLAQVFSCEFCGIFKNTFFMEAVNPRKPLIISAKSSILDVRLGSEYASDFPFCPNGSIPPKKCLNKSNCQK